MNAADVELRKAAKELLNRIDFSNHPGVGIPGGVPQDILDAAHRLGEALVRQEDE